MTSHYQRLRGLLDSLEARLTDDAEACQRVTAALEEVLGRLRRDTRDPRLQQLTDRLGELEERLEASSCGLIESLVGPMKGEVEALESARAGSPLAGVLSSLMDQPEHFSPKTFCDRLLDTLIEVTGAERGFLLVSNPESTEAQILSARHFETADLGAREHEVSRTLVRRMLSERRPLVIEDASRDLSLAAVGSVQRFELRSVLVAPLLHRGQALGGIYLEHRTRPALFSEEEAHLLEAVATVAVFCLARARLLPPPLEGPGRAHLAVEQVRGEIVGRDPKFLEVLAMIRRVADAPATVLVQGETGTGKDLVARMLHFEGRRRRGPFVTVNCAAIPEQLLESELFGHERGAFTGAVDRYVGRIEQADGGTLFLDEVGELAAPLQAKLLRALQSGEISRLGGRRTIRVDVRVVAATSRPLRDLVEQGRFHEALFYRLNVVPVSLPPLRERPSDIPLLVEHFRRKYCDLYERRLELSTEVTDWLQAYPFPGNVRELENLIHRLVALTPGEVVELGSLPPEMLGIPAGRLLLVDGGGPVDLSSAATSMEDIERRRQAWRHLLGSQQRDLAERTVAACDGNVTRAARQLGVHRVTLYKLLRGPQG